MPTINVRHLQSKIGQVLGQVEHAGETFIITNSGRPVAQLGPLQETPMPPASNSVTARELLTAYLNVFHGDRKRIRRQLRAEIDQRLTALDLLDEEPANPATTNTTT
ncbi:MAG: hypothetical protein KIT87_03915 [Anaerolineae bacterium]|nr:hypothetical protein [Anaerolineae bacterium]